MIGGLIGGRSEPAGHDDAASAEDGPTTPTATAVEDHDIQLPRQIDPTPSGTARRPA